MPGATALTPVEGQGWLSRRKAAQDGLAHTSGNWLRAGLDEGEDVATRVPLIVQRASSGLAHVAGWGLQEQPEGES